jgi:hypothetical protein
MSCYWHIQCLTCGVRNSFYNANHADRAMAIIVKHAKAIAALAPFLEEIDRETTIEFGILNEGAIDVAWFAAHQDHDLRPINEYGQLFGQCVEYVECGSCDTRHHCKLDAKHDGPCLSKRPEVLQ